jgi:hypothetical protein
MRDSRHMSIKPSLSKKRSRDEFEDESSISSSDSQDSTSKDDRKPAAKQIDATATRGSSSCPPKEAVIELFSENLMGRVWGKMEMYSTSTSK